MQILWTFSEYLEAVAIIPQLVLLQRLKEVENLTSNYVFAIGACVNVVCIAEALPVSLRAHAPVASRVCQVPSALHPELDLQVPDDTVLSSLHLLVLWCGANSLVCRLLLLLREEVRARST